MSLISRIEINNYLTEGLNSSRRVADWSPMLTGITLSMDGGQSALVNMTNGGGKTSLVELLLYLLSRDSRLLRRLRDKVAPKAKGYTHARIEFHSPKDDTFQAPGLLEPDPEYLNGETRVIGVVLNDDSNDVPIFYSYSGTLEDSPCYRYEESRIVAVPDAEFVARTRGIAGCYWNRHTSRREWEDHIGLFLPVEVVRRNVIYQLKGSDDQNASFFSFQMKGARSYDEAFFRSAIAPDLLTNLLNSWSDENETTIEDTLFNSLSRIVDAEREVARKQAHLAAREAGIEQLRPILEAGRVVNKLRDDRDNVLRSLSTSIALVHRFGAPDSSRVLPGLPRPPSSLVKDSIQDRRIGDAIRGMVLTADNGVLLLSTTLASLAKLSNSQLQEIVDENKIVSISVGQRAIDVSDTFAGKQTARGGTRRGFVHTEAVALARHISKSGPDSGDIVHVIEMAFDIAHSQIDTNPAAHRGRMLERQLREKRAQREAAAEAGRIAKDKADQLSGQLESRQENQAAWEDFGRIGVLLPAEVKTNPTAAKQWLDVTFHAYQDESRAREGKRGRLSEAWSNYSKVLTNAGIEGMAAVEREHEELTRERASIRQEGQAIARERPKVRANLNESQHAVTTARKRVDIVRPQLESFAQLLPGYDLFVKSFGDAHPEDIDPEADLKRLVDEIEKQQQALNQLADELRELKEGEYAMQQYGTIYGDKDPRQVDPLAEQQSTSDSLMRLKEKLATFIEPMEALTEFKKSSGGVDAQTWLETVDANRSKLARSIAALQDEIELAERELDAIEQMTVLDDATYAEAWSTLAEAGIKPTRLFDVLQASDLRLEVKRSALSALSGLLSAPVLECADDVSAAAACLDSARINVPLVLRPALLGAVKSGNVEFSEENAGDVAICGYLAGTYSHRVRVLAEPDYAKAELKRVTEQIVNAENELRLLEAEASSLATTTPGYQCALRAFKAERDQIPEKFERLNSEVEILQDKLRELKPRVEESALQILFAARKFLALGGVRRLEALDTSIVAVKDQLQSLETRRGEAEVRASFENLQAIGSARKYVGLGGRTEHKRSRDTYELASLNFDEATDRLVAAQQASGELDERETTLQERADQFETSGSVERMSSLSEAISFDGRPDDVSFMRDFEKESVALAGRGDALLKAMKVNFERAAAFLTLIDHTEQALQQALTEQRHLVDRQEAHVQELDWAVNRIQVTEVPAWEALRRAIHELAWEVHDRMLATHQAASQLTSVDAGTGVAEADPIYPLLDRVQRLLGSDTLTSHEGVANRVSETAAALADLDIDSRLQGFYSAQASLQAAETGFQTRNDTFCEAVRQTLGTRDSLFNQLELEQIERATPKSIESLSTLFERLGEVARKEREDAQRAQTVAQDANNDTLSQLAGLIRIAHDNLEALERVMARYPDGRFFISADIVSVERIAEILDDLKEEVERASRESREKKAESNRSRRTQDETRVKQILRESLIERVFLEPQVGFVNAGIHGGRRQPVMATLSTGQKIALEFMWIVRQAEYEIERGMRELTARQAARSRARLHRVIFIDGIFSTLSDRSIIREALNGLRGLGGNFQIVGFLHSPTWVNDYSVFPVYHVGKKLSTAAGRGLVTFSEAGRQDGTVGFFSSINKVRKDTGVESAIGQPAVMPKQELNDVLSIEPVLKANASLWGADEDNSQRPGM